MQPGDLISVDLVILVPSYEMNTLSDNETDHEGLILCFHDIEEVNFKFSLISPVDFNKNEKSKDLQ